jgi:NAD(P)-dependent dehydrogenase (short-subunit alcohol dehydrogenase family)
VAQAPRPPAPQREADPPAGLWAGMADDKREAMFAGAAQRLPARRVGLPEDIANAVLFLATTSFATGSTVRVDGGGAIA